MNLPACRNTAARFGTICAALLAAVALAPQASATEWTRNYTVTGRANVRIDTNDGGVRVSTSDSKNVEFRVEYEGYEMDKNLHVEAHQSGDRWSSSRGLQDTGDFRGARTGGVCA
jgi:hypothetical protein